MWCVKIFYAKLYSDGIWKIIPALHYNAKNKFQTKVFYFTA